MKVSIVNNRWMIAVSLISLALILILSLIREFRIHPGKVVGYALQILTEIAYVLLVWFMISILQYNREPISVQTPFSIFLGLEVIDFIAQISPGKLTSPLLLGLGILVLIVLVYVAVASFRVKTAYIAMAFRFFGTSLLITVLVRASIPILSVLLGKPLRSTSIGIIGEVPLLAILYLLFQNERHLKQAAYSKQSDNLS